MSARNLPRKPGFPQRACVSLRHHPRGLREISAPCGSTSAAALIQPLFVRPRTSIRQEIWQCRGSVSCRSTKCCATTEHRPRPDVGGVILFGIPAEERPARPAMPTSESGIVATGGGATEAPPRPICWSFPMSAFASTPITATAASMNQATGRTDVDNDATLELLAKQVVSHAQAGRRYGRAQRDDGRHGRRDSSKLSMAAVSAHCR